MHEDAIEVKAHEENAMGASVLLTGGSLPLRSFFRRIEVQGPTALPFTPALPAGRRSSHVFRPVPSTMAHADLDQAYGPAPQGALVCFAASGPTFIG